MGDGKAVASEMLGSRVAPLLYCQWRDAKVLEPRFGEKNAVRHLKIEKYLLIL